FCLPNRAVLNRLRRPFLCYFEYCLELGFWILGFAEYCLGFGSWALELAVVACLAAATTFCAASARSCAAITARNDSAINCYPASTFVHSSLTTSGTGKCTFFISLMIPCAITSHRIIPPKMFTRIAFTFLS